MKPALKKPSPDGGTTRGNNSIRVVLVRPEHDINVGSACRAMKNFGVKDLGIVAPTAKLGFEAKLFAKHSDEVLSNAKKTRTIAQATAGFDVVVGTTGVADRFAAGLKNTITPKQLPQFIAGRRAAILFGGESTGLSREEIAACDAIVTIPTSPEHAVLNLSHAVAVVLYEVYASSNGITTSKTHAQADRKARMVVEQAFALLASHNPVVEHPAKVARAFGNIIERAKPSNEELNAIMAVLGPLTRKLRTGKKRK